MCLFPGFTLNWFSKLKNERLKTSQSLTALERDKGTSNYRAKVKRGAQFCEGSENTLKFICNFGVNLGDRIR